MSTQCSYCLSLGEHMILVNGKYLDISCAEAIIEIGSGSDELDTMIQEALDAFRADKCPSCHSHSEGGLCDSCVVAMSQLDDPSLYEPENWDDDGEPPEPSAGSVQDTEACPNCRHVECICEYDACIVCGKVDHHAFDWDTTGHVGHYALTNSEGKIYAIAWGCQHHTDEEIEATKLGFLTKHYFA